MTGLRARLTAALVLLSVLALAITAVSLPAPLNRRLRDDALTSPEETATTAEPVRGAIERACRAESLRLVLDGARDELVERPRSMTADFVPRDSQPAS